MPSRRGKRRRGFHTKAARAGREIQRLFCEDSCPRAAIPASGWALRNVDIAKIAGELVDESIGRVLAALASDRKTFDEPWPRGAELWRDALSRARLLVKTGRGDVVFAPLPGGLPYALPDPLIAYIIPRAFGASDLILTIAKDKSGVIAYGLMRVYTPAIADTTAGTAVAGVMIESRATLTLLEDGYCARVDVEPELNVWLGRTREPFTIQLRPKEVVEGKCPA